MSKFIVMVDGFTDPKEIEASSPQNAAEKLANEPDSGVEEDDVILVAEKFWKFSVSSKKVAKQIVVKKNKKSTQG